MRQWKEEEPIKGYYPAGGSSRASGYLSRVSNSPHFVLRILTWLTLAVVASFAQNKIAFEVATIKPAAALDPVAEMAAIRAGQPRRGPHISPDRAEFTSMSLKELLALSHAILEQQVTGPGWLSTEKFDIAAKLPKGASKRDVPQMLRVLLTERFNVKSHREPATRPVLALVAAKGRPNLRVSKEVPAAFNESTPLKPGEMEVDRPGGPGAVRVRFDRGSQISNMGVNGVVSQRMNPASKLLHLESTAVTMAGLAAVLTEISESDPTGSPMTIDDTGLRGYFVIALDISMEAFYAAARTADGSAAGGGSMASSFNEAVRSLGLRLESRKMTVERLVVDAALRKPTEN